MDVNAVHSIKDSSPIVSNPSGKVIPVRLLQPRKALPSMVSKEVGSVTLAGIVIVYKYLFQLSESSKPASTKPTSVTFLSSSFSSPSTVTGIFRIIFSRRGLKKSSIPVFYISRIGNIFGTFNKFIRRHFFLYRQLSIYSKSINTFVINKLFYIRHTVCHIVFN